MNCLICNKSDLKVVYRDRMHGERFFVFQCKKCRFIFTYPIFSTEELSRFYPPNYYSFVPRRSNCLLPEGNTPKKKIRRELRKLLLKEKNYSFEIEQSVISSMLRVFLPIYRYLATEIYPRNKDGGRLLDIGCGCGEYLVSLRMLHWDVYGIDVNREAAFYAGNNCGLKVICGEIFDAGFPGDFFDVITLHHTLEHVSSLLETLEEIRRILKKDGEIIITVPNIWNWERILFGRFWWAWDIPRHLWHFSPLSLERLLRKTGFEKTKVCYQADMYNFPKNIRNMMTDILQDQAGLMNLLFEQDKLRFVTKYFMAPIGLIGALLRVSEQFVVFARKR